MRAPNQSTLLVPVSIAEPIVGDWRARYDPVAKMGIPAHITILYPFMAPERIDGAVERELALLFASRAAFDFQLVATRRFPRTLYLAPAANGPWVDLTRLVVSRFPDHPPYEGTFDTITPHLTVADDVELAVIEQIEPTIAAALPVRARATEVWLMESEQRMWRTRSTFPLA
jgi:2'-5' RNA ligase